MRPFHMHCAIACIAAIAPLASADLFPLAPLAPNGLVTSVPQVIDPVNPAGNSLAGYDQVALHASQWLGVNTLDTLLIMSSQVWRSQTDQSLAFTYRFYRYNNTNGPLGIAMPFPTTTDYSMQVGYFPLPGNPGAFVVPSSVESYNDGTYAGLTLWYDTWPSDRHESGFFLLVTTASEYQLVGTSTIIGSPSDDTYLGALFVPAGAAVPSCTAANIVSHPQAATSCPTGTATFSIAASGTAPFTYQWRAGGVAINSSAGAGGNPSAATATLTLMNVQLSDSDVYDCIVTNSCGSVTSDPATVTICIGDFNCDGGIDGSDVDTFFDAWAAGNANGDVNEDGGIDGADVELFFERWSAGC